MTTHSLDAMLKKVQALISRADHPNTPPAEADACRTKAELLMFKYRIDEMQLGTVQGNGGIAPMWRDILVKEGYGEFTTYYATLMSWIIEHLECRVAMKFKGSKLIAEACGYESDLAFAELLMTSCALVFGQKLEPKYDPALSDQENAYAMRNAGMEGIRIATAIWGTTKRDENWKAQCRKVRKMFKDECVKRGENPAVLLGQGNPVKLFRKSYADGFISEVYYRLRDMRLARGAEGTIVLKSRKEKVDEAFYERFPAYRPRKVSGEIGETEGSAGPCPKCAKAKSGKCRDHSYRKPKERKLNEAGYYRGQSAAQQVNMGGER